MSNSIVTAADVRKLRELTGVGMQKCQEALVITHGDIPAAVVHLRKIGAATAVNKSARSAKNGMLQCAENEHYLVMLEINSETDFVAKNDLFQKFVEECANISLQSHADSIAKLEKSPLISDPKKTVEDRRIELVLSLGENLQLRRIHLYKKNPGHSYGWYSHMGGKIVSFVDIQGANVSDLAKEIAVHVVAEAPIYLSKELIPKSVLSQEQEILRAQIPAGKPENVTQNIIQGKLKAFYETNCLLSQKYVKDNAYTVEEFIKKTDPNCRIEKFLRWQLGEEVNSSL